MVVSRQTSTVSNYSKLVKASLIGSTVAGVVFGIYMQVMGMMPVLASMLGSESIVLGVLHGVIIWFIGPLLVMSVTMGMGPMIGELFASARRL